MKLECNQGGAVALLQRLSSIINKQMEEASQTFKISHVFEAKESLDETSSQLTLCQNKKALNQLTSFPDKLKTKFYLLVLNFF